MTCPKHITHQQEQNNPHTKDLDQNQLTYGMERTTRRLPALHKFNKELDTHYDNNNNNNNDNNNNNI